MSDGVLLSLQNGRCEGQLQSSLLFESKQELANHICCHNSKYAEPSGYFQGTPLVQSMQAADGTTTFYDSVCGRPLFVAPKGRSLQDFTAEMSAHGWPSFREEEWVKENIVVSPDGDAEAGEMHSVCGTHLGHNLPDAGGNRACIDLVCISGKTA